MASTAPTTPATPTPAVKNSKISKQQPMTKNKKAMGGLATVWNISSIRPRPENRTNVATFSVLPWSLSSSVTVSSTTPATPPTSTTAPSMASTMLFTVGTPSSDVSSRNTPSLRASANDIEPLRNRSAPAPRSTVAPCSASNSPVWPMRLPATMAVTSATPNN